MMKSGEYRSGRITDEQLLDDLKNLYKSLGRVPTGPDFDIIASGRVIKYYRRFGSLSRALELCGLPTEDVDMQKGRQYKPSAEKLLRELKRVAQELGHTPTDEQFRKHGRCSTNPYWIKFGSWAKACELAGLTPHTTLEGGIYPTRYYEHTRLDGITVKLQGSYEYRFAKVLDSTQEPWVCHGEFPPLRYKDKSGKPHKYTPDFFIPSLSLYVEIKGYFWDKDKEKMKMVVSQNPSIKISLVTERTLRQFEKSSSVYSLPLLH